MIKGYLDRVDQKQAAGWAFEPNAPKPLRVRAVLEGVTLAEGCADRMRPDVAAQLKTSGSHGFTILLPKIAPDSLDKIEVEAQHGETWVKLKRSTRAGILDQIGIQPAPQKKGEFPQNVRGIDQETALLRKAVVGSYPLPDLATLRQSGPFPSVEHFFESSFPYFRQLRYYTRMRRTSRLLDFGCGYGRLAIPLSAYLDRDEGHYCGIDTDAAVVRHNVATFAAVPNIEFRHVDIYSKQYNPDGRPMASLNEQHFAAPFDLAFLFSVFTHVLPDDLDTLVGFLASNLAPRGEILSTWFLINAETDAAIEQGLAWMRFATPYGSARIDREDVPEAAVAYPEPLAVEAFRRAGFTEVSVHYGNWRGSIDSWLGQDLIVARR
jgi:SAM-dependent methyltransferase